MPYAVTCKSCSARFSVADDLFRKKLQGKLVTLRCRQCGSAIRINASKSAPPPGPPTPAPTSQLTESEPANSREQLPRDDLEDEETFVALSPGLLGSEAPARPGSELFEPTPAPSRNVVDLSEVAQSEPPSPVSEPRVGTSDAPKLSELVHTPEPIKSHSTEDVDFLLGLSSGPGTNARLTSPVASDQTSPVELAPVNESPSSPAPARAGTESASSPGRATAPEPPVPASKESGALRYVLLAAALLGAVYVVVTRGRPAVQEPTQPDLPALLASTEPDPADSVIDEPSGDTAGAPKGGDPSANAAEPVSATPSPQARPPQAAKDPSPENSATGGNSAASQATASPTEAVPEAVFDRAAAATALNTAAAEATACRKPGDPSGTASVVVTFAPSGRVTSATLNGPPFAGTATGGCIATTLRGARVPAFQGDKVTVAKNVVIR